MNCSFAKFYDILYSNVDATYMYIFHFLAIFSHKIFKEKDAFLKLEFL